VYVKCTVYSGTVICVCTVQSVEGDSYWCVYSAQCRVRLFWCVYIAQFRVKLLLVCVEFTVQNGTVFGVCKVHSVEWDSYLCVYSAECRGRLLLVCVQCTVQSETVIGVCTVHTVE